MISSNDQNLVYNHRISSVGPSRVTGSDVVYELTGIDLAMKLHYLKCVYIFSSEASQGITNTHVKESFFYWCNDYYRTCGRFRRSETGRPFMKCNDCGIRAIEAQCDMTVDEWLNMKDCSINNKLVYHQPIGPELFFSPPVYVQMTRFKCGGMSLGLSLAHVLGDPFSASDCFNVWGQFLSRLKSCGPLQLPKSLDKIEKSENTIHPFSVKRVDSVGDHWVTANNCKMETFSLFLTASQVSHLLSNIWGQTPIKKETPPVFESICAVMWQCIAKIREGHDPKIVTICKKDPNFPKREIWSNSQIIISSVEVHFSIIDADLKKLTKSLQDCATDERKQIEEIVEKNDGSLDYIIYGANLTFFDFEKSNLYGLEWKGHKPLFAHYTLQGVGDEGAVLVLPWPENHGNYDGNGRIVTVILPENEVAKLKYELKENGLLLEK